MSVFKKKEIYNVEQSRNGYKYKKNFDTQAEKLFRPWIQTGSQDYFTTQKCHGLDLLFLKFRLLDWNKIKLGYKHMLRFVTESRESREDAKEKNCRKIKQQTKKNA